MSEIKNPYSKDSQEGKYLTYEHGFHSKSEEDNPYFKEEEPDLYSVWMKGFRANKNRPKEMKEDNIPTAAIIVSTLTDVATDLLEMELKKRKLKELQSLNQQASQLETQLLVVQTKINKLNVLLGD